MLKYTICLVLLAGCNSDQVWLGAMVAGQAADYLTTERNLDHGLREQNRIFLSARPDDDDLLLFKAGVTAFFLIAGELDPEHKQFYYKVGCIGGIAAAGYNQWAYEHRY